MLPQHTTQLPLFTFCECGCGQVTIVRRGKPRRFLPKHYQALRQTRPLADRFWEKVSKDGPTPVHCTELGPCWMWVGAHSSRGYGEIKGEGHDAPLLRAPRVSYELHLGAIPKDLWVLHRCDNPPCVNPSHLFLGNAKDNSVDMTAKGRHVMQQGRNFFRGSKNPMAKLNEFTVALIRERYIAGGITGKQLARDFNISPMAVSRLIRGLSWNLPP